MLLRTETSGEGGTKSIARTLSITNATCRTFMMTAISGFNISRRRTDIEVTTVTQTKKCPLNLRCFCIHPV